MATLITRPMRNVKQSWWSSDYTYIDDVVTSPDIDGTADYNEAQKNDANEVEEYELTPIPHAIVSEVSVFILANGVGSTRTMNAYYNIGGSVSAVKSFSVVTTGFAWYTDTWTGLSLTMNMQNNIRIGVGTQASSDKLRVAVAYFLITYTLESWGKIEGGSIQGGSIQ